MTRVETLKAVCSIPIAVVGPATAARLERWRLRPQLIPADFRAEGLLQAFPEKLDGARILFPRAETARELLPEELRRRGAAVDIVVVYRTVKGAGTEDLPALLARERIDCIAFTSPSTARFAAAALSEEPRLLDSIPVAVIGPVTRGAVEEMGFRATIEAGRATAEDLASAIEVYFSGESREAIPKTDR
jgi:uroporphyrinogen III methyltransferase/synthase